jgi:hypothetical protein
MMTSLQQLRGLLRPPENISRRPASGGQRNFATCHVNYQAAMIFRQPSPFRQAALGHEDKTGFPYRMELAE